MSMLGVLSSNLRYHAGRFYHTQNATSQHLATPAPATKGPQASSAPVSHILQDWFGWTPVPGREWGGGQVSPELRPRPSAPHPRQSRDPLFPATPRDSGRLSAHHPSTPQR